MENVRGHAFISYVREDKDRVDRLEAILKAAGVEVWRDTAALWPGENWRTKIREAVTKDALAFIACFSTNSEAREVSGQNEELVLALDQLRLRRPDQVWLIPVRFDDCQVPDLEIGGGRTLGDIQRVDLTDDNWDAGAARLIASVLRILDRHDAVEAARKATSAAAASTFAQRLKAALRDPAGDIAVRDLVMPLADAAHAAISDEDRFPSTSAMMQKPAGEAALYIADLTREFMSVLDPVLDALIVGCPWSLEQHERTWSRLIERIAHRHADGAGMVVLTRLRWFPIVVAMYAGGIAALAENNYGALRALAIDARVRDREGVAPALARAHPWRPFSDFELGAQVLAFQAAGEDVTAEMAELIRERRIGNRYTPVSDFLHDTLRPKLADLLPNDDEYTEIFDRFEILMGLMTVDLRNQDMPAWVPPPNYGSFTWRNRYYSPENQPDRRMLQELLTQQDQWPPLRAGLFGGSIARANAAFDLFIAGADTARNQRF